MWRILLFYYVATFSYSAHTSVKLQGWNIGCYFVSHGLLAVEWCVRLHTVSAGVMYRRQGTRLGFSLIRPDLIYSCSHTPQITHHVTMWTVSYVILLWSWWYLWALNFVDFDLISVIFRWVLALIWNGDFHTCYLCVYLPWLDWMCTM